MTKRNTETLFLRVDPEVARMVRRASDERQLSQSQIAEAALRQYLAETTTAEERKNLLSTVEEALVARVDRRLADTLNRIANLYAKEAFDHAEGLFLTKALVSMAARDERMVERILENARRDATERLKRRAGPEAEIIAQARGQAERLEAQLRQARSETAQERSRADTAEAQLRETQSQIRALQEQLREQRRVNEEERRRDEWAASQLENQGVLRRKTLQEWRDEYDRQRLAKPGRS